MYEIEYTTGFVLFWGVLLSVATIFGDLLYIAYVLMAMLILISHEHAHAEECIKNSVEIQGIEFTLWGGMVKADIEKDPVSAVPIIAAGIKDTAIYAIGLSAILILLTIFGKYLVGGHVFLIIPMRDFLWWAAQFAIITVIANIIPGTFHHKTLGVIRTDGWAAWHYLEMRDELWNDAKAKL
jgi:hypothetical protein